MQVSSEGFVEVEKGRLDHSSTVQGLEVGRC